MGTVDEQLYREHLNGETYREIAERRGFTTKSVRGRVGRYRRGLEAAQLRAENAQLKAQVIQLESVADDLYYPSARDINDFDKWLALVGKLETLPRSVKVMFFADAHFPDVDYQALELALKIAEVYKPDVNVWLGDEADFDTLSTHWPRASHRKHVDAFKEFGRAWLPAIKDVTSATGGVPNVVIGGNHTFSRVESYISSQAVALDDTIIEAFISTMRAGGLAWWTGWIDELWLGDLHMEHGRRVGEQSAKNALKDVGYASPRVGGHAHGAAFSYNYSLYRVDNYSPPQRRLVQSWTLPCLANKVPHYFTGMSRAQRKLQDIKSRWVNGVGVARVNLQDVNVHIEPIIFHERRDGKLAAVFGEHEFVQAAVASGRRVA